MRFVKFLAAILVLALVIMACSSEPSVEEVQTVEEPESDIGEAAEYPAPADEISDVEEYPGPPSSPKRDKPDVTYPGVEDGGEVIWLQAVEMIMNGEAVQIVQTQDLKVSITLRDGRTLITYQPVIDEVFVILKACDAPCADVSVQTE